MRPYRLSLYQRLRPTKIYRCGSRNKTGRKRLHWEHIEGGVGVIKGISKRVVVVNSPDPKVFEQAIFILREDFMDATGVSESDVMRQAEEIADGFVTSGAARPKGRFWSRVPAPVFLIIGAVATGIAWVVMQLL